MFDYVRTTPCVLFFDEFETVGKERGDMHETGGIKRVVSSLLINKLSGISWFKEAVRDIRVFKVEDWSDFTEIVKQN